MSDVPEGSTVLLKEGPTWWNGPYSPFFFANFAGKNFRILLSKESGPGQEDLHNPLVLYCFKYLPPDSVSFYAFEFREACSMLEQPYVFLCGLKAPPQTRTR